MTVPAVVAVALAAALLFIVSSNRSTAAISGHNIATFLVIGLSLGGIYAITAGGLVVTYSTTGIFNFAHGAIGCFLAFVYWELRVNRGWPTLPALILVIFVLAPGIGLALDKVLMRRLRDAPLVVQLMVTVGLMLALMGICATIWKPTERRDLPSFYEGSQGLQIGEVTATWHRIITVVVAIVIAVLLRTLLYRTRLGISMRAVVDDRSLAGLTGVRPGMISGASWALGCMTAAIAGILIAPETGMVVENLTLVIIVAFAAAAIGQLKSLPWAFAGGLLIGLAKAFSGVFLSFGREWSYAPEAIPAVVLFIAVLFLPQARLETGRLKQTARTERLTGPVEAVVATVAIVGALVAWANGWIPWFGTNFGQRTDVWLGRGATFLVVGILMLSLVPLTGWAGQVTFANFAIAGIGAILYSRLGGQDGNAIGILWVMLICAPLGAAIAVPAVRLKGLYLALATMAFAEFADKVIVRHPEMLDPSATGVLYQPLRLLGFEMGSDSSNRKAFVIFLALTFGALFLLMTLLRRTRWARRWIAISDSPAAAATIGVGIMRTKIAVFALSGAIAGFGGCMLGLSKGALQVDSFPLFAGLPMVLLLAGFGVRYPVAAFLGVLALASFPAWFEFLGQPSWLTSIELVGPGLGAIAQAYQPEGGVYYMGRDLSWLLPWRRRDREERSLATAKRRARDVTRDEINDLGLTRAFTVEKVSQLDRALDITDAMLRRPAMEDMAPAEEVPRGAHVG